MLRALSTVALILLAASPILAQGRTSSGLFGSRTIGSSINPGSRNAFGSGSSFGGAGGSGASQLSNTGQVTGSERFLRSNRSAGQFVGSDNADSAFVGALSGNSGFGGSSGFGAGGRSQGGGALGNLGSGRGTSNQRQSNQRGGQNGRNGSTSSNRRINVRTTLEVGFRYHSSPATAVQTRLSDRLNKTRLSRLGTLDVGLKDRVATLRGRVASRDDRSLAVRLAKMEPGVDTVVDELVVDSSGYDSVSPFDRP